MYLDSLGMNTTTYTDTTVNEGNNYSYRVTAYNPAGNSAYSNEKAVEIVPLSNDPNLLLDIPFTGNSSDASIYFRVVEEHGGIGSTEDRHGDSNAAYSFDGTDDYLSIEYDPGFDLTEVSLGAWIYINSYKDDQRIITRETGTV